MLATGGPVEKGVIFRAVFGIVIYLLLDGISEGRICQASDRGDAAVAKRFESALSAAYRARTARSAISILDTFEATEKFPDSVRSRLQIQREKFLEFDRKDLLRLGNKWVTPNEFKEAAQKCSEELDAARESLKQGDGKAMVGHLERAAKWNPNAIEPNFFMGMLFSIRGNCNAPVAERYFEKVAVLNPDYAPVLNNLALTEIKLGKFDEAYVHWKQLAQINPRCPELLQNLGRIEREGAADRLLIPKKKTASSNAKTRFELFVDLAESTRTAAGVTDANLGLGKGWLYSPLVRAWGEEIAPKGDLPEPSVVSHTVG